MALSVGTHSDQTASAAWNAIATIKANSPFAGPDSSTSNVADEFDSLIDHSTADALDGNTSAAGAGASIGRASNLELMRQIRSAQQSTIDLFA